MTFLIIFLELFDEFIMLVISSIIYFYFFKSNKQIRKEIQIDKTKIKNQIFVVKILLPTNIHQ
jgi:hypothetical protein